MAKKKSIAQSFISFPPFGSKNPEILILGMAPGVESLSCGKYYAETNNCFWEMIENTYNSGKSFPTEACKEKCLDKNKIVLWDLYKSGTRIGSLSKTIKNGTLNDIEGFIKKNTSIKLIICNGKDVADILWREFIPVPILIAPNTSSTPQRIVKNKTEKIKIWKKFLK